MARRPETRVADRYELEELFRQEGPGYVPMPLPNGEESCVLDFEARFSAYDPGRSYGPPEDCYPPEGGELEDMDVRHDGQPFDCAGLWVRRRAIVGRDDQRLPIWGDKWVKLEAAIGEYAAERAADGSDGSPASRLREWPASWLAG